MIRLYYVPGACSRASHIALEETGAAYEARRVDFATNEQRSPEYLALNPKGRVPALVTDGGVLTENVAILAYLGQAFPAARLIPADPWEFAQAQAFNAYLSSTVHVAHAHGRRGARWADEESSFADMRRKAPKNVAECMELIQVSMFQGPWVLGDAYSVCDIYLFTLFGWMEPNGLDPKAFPRLAEHSERVAARPAVRRVLDREAA